MSFKSTSYLNAANPNPSFPRISAGSTKSQLITGSTGAGRLKQIVLMNKKSLNNAVADTIAKHGGQGCLVAAQGAAEQSSETFSSFSKHTCSNHDSSHITAAYGLATQRTNADSVLVRNPFKQSRSKLTNNSQVPPPPPPPQHQQGQYYRVSPNSAKTNGTAPSNVSMPFRSIHGLDQFSQFNAYNPSTNLILKTANSINEFVDFFEKTRTNTAALHGIMGQRPRGCRQSKYSGLKPLSCVKASGPAIQNCLGVVNEPKGDPNDNPMQLKDLYEQKLKQLAHKRKADSQLQERGGGGTDNYNNTINLNLKSLEDQTERE